MLYPFLVQVARGERAGGPARGAGRRGVVVDHHPHVEPSAIRRRPDRRSRTRSSDTDPSGQGDLTMIDATQALPIGCRYRSNSSMPPILSAAYKWIDTAARHGLPRGLTTMLQLYVPHTAGWLAAPKVYGAFYRPAAAPRHHRPPLDTSPAWHTSMGAVDDARGAAGNQGRGDARPRCSRSPMSCGRPSIYRRPVRPSCPSSRPARASRASACRGRRQGCDAGRRLSPLLPRLQRPGRCAAVRATLGDWSGPRALARARAGQVRPARPQAATMRTQQ